MNDCNLMNLLFKNYTKHVSVLIHGVILDYDIITVKGTGCFWNLSLAVFCCFTVNSKESLVISSGY